MLDANGMIVEIEIELAVADLPAAAINYVSANYGSEKIREASKITSANGTITYEAEVSKKDLIFDASGKFIKTEAEAKGDHDD